MYRLYEMRLRQGLAASKSELPRHIAVLCDGNRRWARDAGHDDVSYGYRVGAAKIAEMLRWCQEAGIEMATVYLLSTENLQRDPEELSSLIEIITDVVEEICAPANRWSVRTVGDLELLGEEPARRLRDAVESTQRPRRLPRQRRRRLRRTAGDRRRGAGAARQGTRQRRDRRAADRGRHRRGDLGEPVHLRASPIPIWSSARRGSSGCPVSCCGRARIRRCGSRRPTGRSSGGWISCARCAITPRGTAATAADRLGDGPSARPSAHRGMPHLRHGCAVGVGLLAQLVVGPVPAGP